MLAKVAIILGVSVSCLACGHTGPIPRNPLDAAWESHMLSGTAATYYDGVEFVVNAPPRHSTFEAASGDPDKVWPTTKGIRVQDLREKQLWGLLRNGGWRLQGGLLDRAEIRGHEGYIELYGKSVWKTRPVLFHFSYEPPRSAQHSYEFFLLNRSNESQKAIILQKWTIEADDITPDTYLRGDLEYNQASDVLRVVVESTDGKRAFLDKAIETSKLRKE